jgi:MATE family multidrug resistance protein
MNELSRRFFRLAIVNIISNLMVPLAGLFDVAFLGHLTEIHHLAGVALATVLFNYIYWTFGFLRMSTTGTTAQAIGRSDYESVLVIGLRNGLLAFGLGIAILLLQQPIREFGLTLLSATPAVKASGRAYYDTAIWGAPPTLLNFVLIGWFLGREQGAKVLLLSVIGNLAHVVLDYSFVVRQGWGSAGAGLSLAISQYLTLLSGTIVIYREHWNVKVPDIASRILDRSALKASFVLNSDITVRTLALISAFALFTNLSSFLGTVVLAANTLLLQVVTLAAYFIDGFAFATESLAGILRGKGVREQLAALVQMSGGASLCFGLAIALVFIIFPDILFRLLTNHSEVIARISNYTAWLFPVLGFGSIAFMLDGYFLGLTEGSILRKSSILAALVGFAPVAAVAWQLRSNHLLWLALSLFMLARVLTLGIQVPKTVKKPTLDA